MYGPKPKHWFVDNGCTFAPDGWWREACRWHDWHYSMWSDVSRWQADWFFFLNLWYCRAPLSVCLIKPLVVRFCGRRFYQGRPKKAK